MLQLRRPRGDRVVGLLRRPDRPPGQLRHRLLRAGPPVRRPGPRRARRRRRIRGAAGGGPRHRRRGLPLLRLGGRALLDPGGLHDRRAGDGVRPRDGCHASVLRGLPRGVRRVRGRPGAWDSAGPLRLVPGRGGCRRVALLPDGDGEPADGGGQLRPPGAPLQGLTVAATWPRPPRVLRGGPVRGEPKLRSRGSNAESYNLGGQGMEIGDGRACQRFISTRSAADVQCSKIPGRLHVQVSTRLA
mmetsp:Transcript_80253/g.227260  ORF Transcript_80253/g.227260 Transcript_80253/m.227260 type:complete len:244 (+) Transcript_80253:1022-1753(+)